MTAFQRLVEAIDADLVATRGRRDETHARWTVGPQELEVEAGGVHRADARLLHGVVRPTVLNYDTRLDDLDAFLDRLRAMLLAEHVA